MKNAQKSAKQISMALADRAATIVPVLLPNGKRAGNYWQAGDAFGAVGTSLYVHLAGQHRGQWRDAATGDGGDLLDLIALQQSVSISEAMKLARNLLGDADLAPMITTAGQKPVIDTKKAAIRLWRRTKPILTPYSDHGQAYLAGRGLNAQGFADLHFHHAAWLKIDEQKAEYPAIIAAVRDETGALQAVHRTFLDKEHPIKATFPEPKRALGALTGGACWLRPNGRCLIVAEGIETAMSVGMAFPGAALAAGITAYHLTEMVIPDRFDRVLIAADNDKAGRNAAETLHARLDGRMVITVLPRLKDFNDDLLEDGLAAMKKAIIEQVKTLRGR